MKKFLAAVLTAFLLFSPVQAFELTDLGNQTMQVEGNIEYEDNIKFVDFWNESNDRGDPYQHIILKDSDGGSFEDAVSIGINIYQFGLTTEVVGSCYSACAYIWLAGRIRYAHDEDKIGIHAPAASIVPIDGTVDEGFIDISPQAKKFNEYSAAEASWYLGAINLPLAMAYKFVVETKQPAITAIDRRAIDEFQFDIVYLKEGEHGR